MDSAMDLKVSYSEKLCSSCGELKSITAFYVSTRGYPESRCKECRIEANRIPARKAQLKRRYGMSLEDFDLLLQAQDYACAICHRQSCPVEGILSVDHDHDTGEVRGLLCAMCNRGIGNFADSPELLQSAMAYLEKFRFFDEKDETHE